MTRASAILRADASRRIGLGHLSRAIAVARAFGRAGLDATVFVRELDGDAGCADSKTRAHRSIVRRVESEGEFLSALEVSSARYLVVDLLERPDYEPLVRGLKTAFPRFKTVCFDAFFERELPFDLFVRPLFDAGATAPNALTGLPYYVFPEELRSLAPTKVRRARAERALISLGGSDPFRATAGVARTLCPAFPALRFSAVIGPGFAPDERESLRALAAATPNLRLVVEPENLGALYMDCDLAVTSGGLTKFEAALFGVPSVIVANSSQEEALSEEFAVHGASVFVGRADRVDPKALREAFARLCDPATAESMSRRGREILDGRGGERVIEHIQQTLP